MSAFLRQLQQGVVVYPTRPNPQIRSEGFACVVVWISPDLSRTITHKGIGDFLRRTGGDMNLRRIKLENQEGYRLAFWEEFWEITPAMDLAKRARAIARAFKAVFRVSVTTQGNENGKAVWRLIWRG